LKPGENEFTFLVDTVPRQIHFILPEFLSFIDWCKKNLSSFDNKEIVLIKTLKRISESVDLNNKSYSAPRKSLINARKVCREEVSNFLNGITHEHVLNIYMETSNIEIERVKSASQMSFSHIDCFMRIFFFTDQEKLKELFHLEKGKRGEFVENIFSDEKHAISDRFSRAVLSLKRQKILIDGYKRLLSIIRRNKDFKDIITFRIEKVENIIEKGENFRNVRDLYYIKDFFLGMVMKIAGVLCPYKFQRHY
jgi:hypothetical protein